MATDRYPRYSAFGRPSVRHACELKVCGFGRLIWRGEPGLMGTRQIRFRIEEPPWTHGISAATACGFRGAGSFARSLKSRFRGCLSLLGRWQVDARLALPRKDRSRSPALSSARRASLPGYGRSPREQTRLPGSRAICPPWHLAARVPKSFSPAPPKPPACALASLFPMAWDPSAKPVGVIEAPLLLEEGMLCFSTAVKPSLH